MITPARRSAGPAPRVTVFMAVYDREHVVGDAIRSVLAQTFRDFELLIVDDGSRDRSADVADRFDDPRIRLVRQADNQGIPRTRNHGLDLARGEYLAILDSDDVAFPRRLERQVAFLDAHRDIAAVGGWARRIRADGRRSSPALRPTAPRDIRARIPFTSCFKNPTMTARTAAMREFGYREEFVVCQDIDLWSRMSTRYPLANLPEYLVEYRLGGTSHEDAGLAADMKKRAVAERLQDLGVGLDADDLDRHFRLRNPRKSGFERADLAWVEAWLLRLVAANRTARCYPEPEFTRAAAERWWRVGAAAAASPRRLLAPKPFRDALPAVLSGAARLAGQRLRLGWVRSARPDAGPRTAPAR